MPRRDSTRPSIEDDDDVTPLRRSLRTSTQRDAHHLNYDAKSHPLDAYTRPAQYKRRLKAHDIPVIDLDTDGDDPSDEDADSGDDDDTISYGSRTRKRRSTSSRQSSRMKRRRSNDDDDDRQRCSNLTDIKRMTKLYLNAWEVAIKDLPPPEQLGFQASQYQSAWEQFALPNQPEPVNDDGAISMEDDPTDDLDVMMSTQVNNGLNNFDLAFNASTQRSTMSAADSMQDHLDEAPMLDVAPQVRPISEPRSSFAPIASPPASGRAKRTVDAISIHEDPPSTAVNNWSRQHLNRVMTRPMSRDEQKENDVEDEEEDEEEVAESIVFQEAISRVTSSRLPSRTSTGATESTIAQHASPGKSAEPNTRRFKTPAERGRSGREASSDDTIAAPTAVVGKPSSQGKVPSTSASKPSSQLKAKTVYEDSSEEGSEQDEEEEEEDETREKAVEEEVRSEEEEVRSEEEEEDDEDDDAVKSEPISSSARR